MVKVYSNDWKFKFRIISNILSTKITVDHWRRLPNLECGRFQRCQRLRLLSSRFEISLMYCRDLWICHIMKKMSIGLKMTGNRSGFDTICNDCPSSIIWAFHFHFNSRSFKVTVYVQWGNMDTKVVGDTADKSQDTWRSKHESTWKNTTWTSLFMIKHGR